MNRILGLFIGVMWAVLAVLIGASAITPSVWLAVVACGLVSAQGFIDALGDD